MTDRRTSSRRFFRPLYLAILGLVAVAGCREKGLIVKTDPPGATIWIGEQIQGVAPLEVPVPRDEPLVLRAALPNWEDAVFTVDPGNVPANRMLTLRLERPGTASLVLESKPPGAEVMIDGEFRGKTPLEIHGLEPRRTEVVFRLRDRAQVSRSVDLADPAAPRRLRVELPSLTVEYYKEKIREEPEQIHHYADLGHHYMLEKRFDEAMKTFARGIELLFAKPGIEDSYRLWSEVQRVTEKQYDYGDTRDVDKARRLLRETLLELYKKHPDNRQVMFYVNLIYVLDALDQRQRAQEIFEDAWRKFPGDRSLRRLRRKGFAPP